MISEESINSFMGEGLLQVIFRKYRHALSEILHMWTKGGSVSSHKDAQLPLKVGQFRGETEGCVEVSERSAGG